MRIQHKTARDTAISTVGGRFEVDSEGFLHPTPTMAQWHQFASAQAFFTLHGSIPDPAPRKAAVVAEPVSETSSVWEPSKAKRAQPPVPTPAPAPSEQPSNLIEVEVEDDEDGEDEEETASFADDIDDLDGNTETPTMTYASMSFDELKVAARQRGIKVLRVSKADLISLLNAHDLGI